jgi:hypothetical protein
MSSTVSELLADAQAGAMNGDQPESGAGGDRSLFRLLLEVESSLRKQARAGAGWRLPGAGSFEVEMADLS